LLDRRITAPPVDLRPSSDAGLHLVAEHVLRNPVLELLYKQRSFGPRTDDRHLGLQHVPELRQLVDIRPAEEPAERRSSRIVVAGEDRPALALRVFAHRSELVNHERLTVEPHALLTIKNRPARGELDERGDEAEREREDEEGRARNGNVDRPLHDAVEALQRDVVDVDDGNAVEIFEPGPQRDHLQKIRHHLDVEHLAARAVDELEHAHVLLGGKRDIQMIDRLPRRDFRGVVDRAEQREAAIAKMIPGRTVVDEADNLIAKLAVLENLVGHQAPQLARSGDENPLEADAGAPSPFEDLAHQLARRVSERHVQSEEDAPDQLRHFEDTLFLRRIRREVGLDVQRGDDAEHDGEDAADEDREEIVDA